MIVITWWTTQYYLQDEQWLSDDHLSIQYTCSLPVQWYH